MKAAIRGAYRALISRDVGLMLSFFTEDATLEWASFTFKGREEIRGWAEELVRMFSNIKILEIELVAKGSTAKHEFAIAVTVPDGRKGLLPAMGTYDFNDGKIQRLWITLSWNLIFSREKDRLDLDPENVFVKAISSLRWLLSREEAGLQELKASTSV